MLMFWTRAQAVIWQRLLTCPLYPLRRCLDTVRREFARLCCGLMDAYLDRDLLEHLAGISEEVHCAVCLRERRKAPALLCCTFGGRAGLCWRCFLLLLCVFSNYTGVGVSLPNFLCAL